jgi:predicted nucleotidyltransferase
MTGRDRQLTHLLRRRLTSAQIDPARFFTQADGIIIFGSRAVGVEASDSDLDVLVVGGCNRLKSGGLDLIPVAADRLKMTEWLDSELASHIATYGRWLSGSDSWRHDARVGASAITKKERRLRSLFTAVTQSWDSLHPSFHLRHATTIRRELQRFALLNDGQPVPPTRLLDEWLDRDTILGAVEHLGLISQVPSGLLAAMTVTRRSCSRHPRRADRRTRADADEDTQTREPGRHSRV